MHRHFREITQDSSVKIKNKVEISLLSQSNFECLFDFRSDEIFSFLSEDCFRLQKPELLKCS